jgi:hypothetical protein
MLNENSSINGSIYKLIKLIEFDIELDGDCLPIRVELLQHLSDADQFRTRTWVMALCDRTGRAKVSEVQSILLRGHTSNRLFERSLNEEIFADYAHFTLEDCSEFQADSQEAAIQLIVDDLKHVISYFSSYSG